MKKLYRLIDGDLHYKEAWYDDGEVVFHCGKVGSRGSTEHYLMDESPDDAVREALRPAVEEGFAEIPIEDHFSLMLSYKCEGWGSEEDLDKRHLIEDLLNDELGWAGLGYCDGGQIGTGSMEIFSYVVDPHIACRVLQRCLRRHDLLDGASLQYLEPHSDEPKHLEFPAPQASEGSREPQQPSKRPWWKLW